VEVDSSYSEAAEWVGSMLEAEVGSKLGAVVVGSMLEAEAVGVHSKLGAVVVGSTLEAEAVVVDSKLGAVVVGSTLEAEAVVVDSKLEAAEVVVVGCNQCSLLHKVGTATKCMERMGIRRDLDRVQELVQE